MRTKTDHRFVLDVDPAQVLEALLAVERIPEWSPAHRDVRVATRDEHGRPVRVYATVSLTGTPDRQMLEYECTDHRISWAVAESGAGAGGRGRFEIEHTADGTEIRYHTEMYLPIPVPGILLKRGISRLGEEAMHNLAEFIEKFPFDENYEIG
jgi:hypothetical protein